MPENLPKAVMILLWLLSGTILFGALLMKSTVLNSFVFLLVFFGVPVLGYYLITRKKH
ncbi:MAG: hypothetical protein PVJ72_10660 [Gammaproteobacteria bacterium]|jgi:hypothetical protein